MLRRIMKKEEGFAIVGAIVITAVLSLGAAVLMSRSTDEASKAENAVENAQSLYVAEMGVAYARNILRRWDNWYSWDPQLNTFAQSQDVTLPNGEAGSFNVGLTYNPNGNSTLTVAGTYGEETRLLELEIDSQFDPVFVKSLCACGGDRDHDDDHHDDDDYHEEPGHNDNSDHNDADGDPIFEINGNFATDSYNSQDGGYAAQTPGSMGDIGSVGNIDLGRATINGNVDAEGELSGNPNATVNGDVTLGRTLQNSININGVLTENNIFNKPVCDCNADLSYAVSNAQIDNNNASIPAWALDDEDGEDEWVELELKGNEVLTLDSGVYYLEELEMMGNSKLVINGEVIIYLYDDAELELDGNAILNTDDNASNLRIYLYNEHDEGEVEISGNAALSAAVYAPNAEIEISGNATIYGAVAGGTIKINGNPDVHYDEDIRTKLSDTPTDEAEMMVQQWHECPPGGCV